MKSQRTPKPAKSQITPTSVTSPLNSYMTDLMEKFSDVQIKISDDNARVSFTSNPFVRPVMGSPSPLRSNRWGNASPVFSGSRKTHNQDIPDPPVFEPSACRWGSPGGHHDMGLPLTPPARKKAIKIISPVDRQCRQCHQKMLV